MRIAQRRISSRALMLGLFIAATVWATVFPASPVAAHASLVRTEPANGASLDSSPTQLRLLFDQGVRVPRGGVRLLDSNGKTIVTERPVNENATTIVVGVPAKLSGAYVASWRATSSDGHPIRGAFTFGIGTSTTTDDSRLAALARDLLRGDTKDSTVSVLSIVMRGLHLLALTFVVGVTVTRAVARRPLRLPYAGLVMFAAFGVLVSGIALLLLFGPLTAGLGLSAITDGTLLDDTLRSSTGRAQLIRTVGIAFAGFLVAGVIRREVRVDHQAVTHRAVLPSLLAVVIGVLGQVFSGHGGSGRVVGLSVAMTFVHVIAAATWVGGLLGLAVMGAKSFRQSSTSAVITPEPDLDLVTPGSTDATDPSSALRRFSAIAFWAALAVVGTGTFATWRQVGSLHALTTTSAGQVLLAKVGMVGLMLGFGLRHRRALRATRETTTRMLRRGIAFEAALSIMVVALTALLVDLPPARDVAARPVSARVQAADTLLDATISPARRGRNVVHLYALTPEGVPRNVSSMSLRASLPSAGIEDLTIPVVRAGPNHFQILAADLALAGTWSFTATIRIDEFTEESVTFEAAIR